jgi:hypothetical protein
VEENVAPQGERPGAGTRQPSLPQLLGATSLGDDEFTSEGSTRVTGPPPVQPPTAEQAQRQAPPSIDLAERQKPTYNITVGDPHKVGDLTTSHTEYQVYTKVFDLMLLYTKQRQVVLTHPARPPLKPTVTPSSSSPAASATSSGSITNSTRTTPASSCHRHLKNKHSTASTQTS